MAGAAPHVILVEDDDALRTGVVQALELEGMTVSAHADARAALRAIDADLPGVVVTDVRMPVMDGIELFARIREIDTDIPVIFTTAHGDVDLAVDAMKNGAADFFTKPYAISRLAHAIRLGAEKRALLLENRGLRRQLENREIDGWIGVSPAAEHLQRTVKEVARTETDLLLTGASGTGKSYLARLIHEQSQRASRPLVIVDPGIFANEEADLLLYGRDPSQALSRSGLVERANGGTLVLEEIEQIPRRAQARLLSLVDNRTFYALGSERPRAVDIRVIGTSVRASGMGEGEASGLRSRLAGVTIALPTLAERQQDVPVFFREFLRRYERELDREAAELSEAELRHLLTHDWPGNLRELQMYAQNFVLGLTHVVGPGSSGEQQSSLRDMLASYEKQLLEDALRQAGGSVPQVQQNLDLPRKTLYDKLARYGIRASDFRA